MNTTTLPAIVGEQYLVTHPDHGQFFARVLGYYYYGRLIELQILGERGTLLVSAARTTFAPVPLVVTGQGTSTQLCPEAFEDTK
jgi:hypothetical protein